MAFPQTQAAQPQQESPYRPPGPPDIVWEIFSSLNTNATRPGIKDEECFWLDGFMPIGPNYLRTMWGIGPSIFTAPSGGTIPFFDFFNIGATPYMIAVHSDGGLWAVNTNTNMATRIAPDGTIQNPSRDNVGITQWGSLYLIIVAMQTNGYWIWDGTNFYGAGTLGPGVVIDDGGEDYTSLPTVTAFGGAGSGAAFTATLQGQSVLSVAATAAGTGYNLEDQPIICFSGGGCPGSTAQILGTISGGVVNGSSIVDGGAGYTNSATAAVLGGGGTGATATVTQSGGIINGVTITNGGTGYISQPVIYVTDPLNPVAQASIAVMPFGVSGTAAETYTSRVWVANGATILFTAPESPSNFNTSAGGGNFISTDSFLRVGFTALKQTNGFLYLIGDSSINYISGVQTSAGSPPVTTFTNQNADPEIGTVWPATVDVFSRNILFGNAFGAHVSYGGAVTKISEALDGVYNTVPNFGGLTPSAAKAIVFGKKVWALLLPIINPITGQQQNKLFLWTGKNVWWATDQDVGLVYIQHQEINSVLTAYGTDGENVYPLFAQPSVAFEKIAQSKLWAKPGGYQWVKSADRLWGLVQYFNTNSPSINVSVDNENSSSEDVYDLGPATMNWTTASGQPMNWKTASGAEMVWEVAAIGIIAFEPTEIAQNGVLLGFTLTTNAADVALISMAISPQLPQFRG